MFLSINNSNLTTQKLLHDEAMRICKMDKMKTAKLCDRFAVVTYERLTSSCISDRKKLTTNVLSILQPGGESPCTSVPSLGRSLFHSTEPLKTLPNSWKLVFRHMEDISLGVKDQGVILPAKLKHRLERHGFFNSPLITQAMLSITLARCQMNSKGKKHV